MDEETLLLNLECEIGAEAKRFLEGTLGLALISRQKREIAGYQRQLEDLSVSDEDARAIRVKIAVCRKAFIWMIEAINQADNAANQLELSQTED